MLHIYACLPISFFLINVLYDVIYHARNILCLIDTIYCCSFLVVLLAVQKNRIKSTQLFFQPYLSYLWFDLSLFFSINNILFVVVIMLCGCFVVSISMYDFEFLFRLVAHITDKIKTIDGSKETLKLAIRITELWFVGTPDRSEQAEMVIVDSNVCF